MPRCVVASAAAPQLRLARSAALVAAARPTAASAPPLPDCLPFFWPLTGFAKQDVELADRFFAGHMAPGYTPFPYPRDLFLKFIAENDGAAGLQSMGAWQLV